MKSKTMRKSSIVMLSVLGVLALITVLLVGLGRIAFSRVSSGHDSEQNRIDYRSDAEKHIELKNFRGVTFIGNWKVDMEQGDNWRVDLDYPGDLAEDVRIEIRGDQLILDPGTSGSGHWNWKWWEMEGNKRFSARIVMPELDVLNITGASDLEFKGFRGDNLRITISGAGNIEGEDGSYEELNLIMSGAGNVDMHDMAFDNAEVILSGAGNVSLGMNGGTLSGNLSGFGTIEYFGTVSDERVNVSGFGKVKRKD